jgi:hypothetical protein
MLSFDNRLLADINRTAAKESGMEASEAPQMGADPIGDLIANVGR